MERDRGSVLQRPAPVEAGADRLPAGDLGAATVRRWRAAEEGGERENGVDRESREDGGTGGNAMLDSRPARAGAAARRCSRARSRRPMPSATPAEIARLRSLLDESRRVVVFTGAGISTESGIPDFRSPGGIWTRMQPIYFQRLRRLRGDAPRVVAAQDRAGRHAGRGPSPTAATARSRRSGAAARLLERHHPERRRPAPGLGRARPIASSSSTATPPTPAASTASGATSCEPILSGVRARRDTPACATSAAAS